MSFKRPVPHRVAATTCFSRFSVESFPRSSSLSRVGLASNALQVGLHAVVRDDRGIAELRSDDRLRQLAVLPRHIDFKTAACAQSLHRSTSPGTGQRREQVDLKRTALRVADVALQAASPRRPRMRRNLRPPETARTCRRGSETFACRVEAPVADTRNLRHTPAPRAGFARRSSTRCCRRRAISAGAWRRR